MQTTLHFVSVTVFFFETLYLGQLPRREIVQGRGCGRRQGALRGGVCSGLGGRGGENPREKLKNGRMDELKNGKMEEFCEPNFITQHQYLSHALSIYRS